VFKIKKLQQCCGLLSGTLELVSSSTIPGGEAVPGGSTAQQCYLAAWASSTGQILTSLQGAALQTKGKLRQFTSSKHGTLSSS